MKEIMFFKVVLICFSVCLVYAYPIPSGIISPDEPECKHTNNFLFCDYKNSEKETMYFKQINDVSLEKIFLHNIKKLFLSESLCVNVALQNIDAIELLNENGNQCSKSIEVSAKNCVFDQTPHHIKSLHLEECKVSSLSTTSSLSKLNLINTEVENLNVPFVDTSFSSLIQNSKVSSLQKFGIGSGSKLVIEKSTINITEINGLEIIRKSNVSIQESSVTAEEGSLTLTAGSTLTVTYQQAAMTIVTKPCDARDNPEGQHRGIMALFVICLLLLIMETGFIVCKHKDAITKFWPRKEKTNDLTSINNYVNCQMEMEEQVPLTQPNLVNELKVLQDRVDSVEQASPLETQNEPEEIGELPSPPPVNPLHKILNLAKDISSAIQSKQVEYEKEIEELKKPKLDILTTECSDSPLRISYINFEIISKLRDFQTFLRIREIRFTIEVSLLHGLFDKDDLEGLIDIAQVQYDDGDDDSRFSEKLFIVNNQRLLNLLNGLSFSHTLEDIRKSLNLSDKDTIKSIKMVMEFNSRKEEKCKASIKEFCEKFQEKIQYVYQRELKQDIDRREYLFKYLVDNLNTTKHLQ